MEAKSHSRALLAMVARLAEQNPADVQAILEEFSAADRAELSRLVESYQQGDQTPESWSGPNKSLEANVPVFSAWLTTILTSAEPTPLNRRTRETSQALQRIARDQGWRARASTATTSRVGRLMKTLRFRS